MKKATITIPELSEKHKARFWSKVEKGTACWRWIGSLSSCGYGKISLRGIVYGAHRVAYFLATGAQPEELSVCHKCDNPCCVNPNHLWLGTARDNALDMLAKNRGNAPKGDRTGPRLHPECMKRGEDHYRAKLTEADVLEIRRSYSQHEATQQTLADRYNLHQADISNIVRRKRWKHLKKDFSCEERGNNAYCPK